MAKVIIGGIIGGVVAFAWSMVSWMVLTWHNPTINSLDDESAVKDAVVAGVPSDEPGVYTYPGMAKISADMTPEEKKAAFDECQRKMTEGPFLFAVVRKKGMPSMFVNMGFGAAVNILGAIVVTWLLLQARLQSFMARVTFVVGLALFASVVGYLPNWIWWGYPDMFTIIGIADVMIAWGLAGAVIAIVVGKTPASEGAAT